MAFAVFTKDCLNAHACFYLTIIDFAQKMWQSLGGTVEQYQCIDTRGIRLGGEAVVVALCKSLHGTFARQLEPFADRFQRIGGVQLGWAENFTRLRAFVRENLFIVAQGFQKPRAGLADRPGIRYFNLAVVDDRFNRFAPIAHPVR